MPGRLFYTVVTLLIPSQCFPVGKEPFCLRHSRDGDAKFRSRERLDSENVSGRCGTSGKECTAGLSHGRQVSLVRIDQVEVEMNYVFRGGAGRQQYSLEIMEGLGRLGTQVAGTNHRSAIIESDLAGYIDAFSYLDCLAKSLQPADARRRDELLALQLGQLVGGRPHLTATAASLGCAAEKDGGQGHQKWAGSKRLGHTDSHGQK